jgi:hypothetical protein
MFLTVRLPKKQSDRLFPPPHDQLGQAIGCDDGDQAAKIIQNALGIESDDVVSYCFPKNWPTDREQRAAITSVA